MIIKINKKQMKNANGLLSRINNLPISNKPVGFLVLISFFFSLSFYSCKKTGPAEALVSVRDSSGKAISGATVILRQDTVVSQQTQVKANIYQEKVSDLEGNAFFTFQWEAVLNLEVSKGTLEETDYIRLEQSKTVEKTVVLK